MGGNAGALLLVFLVVLILFSFLSNFISSKLRDSGIGMLDRTLGVAFGGLRGAFIVCLAYFVVVLVCRKKTTPTGSVTPKCARFCKPAFGLW